MIIKFNGNGRLIDAENSDFLSSGFSIRKIAKQDENLSSLPGTDSPTTEIILNDDTIVCIITPTSPICEVYYSLLSDGVFVLSDSLIEIVKSHGKVTYDKASVDYFLKHWTFPTGKTYFHEIERFVPGSKYKIGKTKLIAENVSYGKKHQMQTDEEIYSQFKSNIDSAICESATDNNSIYFSGGADSLLIALILSKYNITFTLYTSKNIPEFGSNKSDVFKSVGMADKFGWKHRVIDIDLDKFSVDKLDPIVQKMPLSSHSVFDFKILSEAMVSDGVTNSYSGQNMDNLYNYGPTTPLSFNKSSIADLIRRMFLIEPYFKVLDKNCSEVNILARAIWKITAWVGAIAYGFFKKIKCRPSSSCGELIYNYISSNDYITFTCGDGAPLVGDVAHSEVREKLLDYKIKNYMMSGPPQAIYQSGRDSGLNVVLPFSTSKVVNSFYGMSMGYQDILNPKRYVYQYIKELAGQSYSEIYKSKEEDALTYQEWCFEMLNHTVFGQSLIKKININNVKVKDLTEAHKYQNYLTEYWHVSVMEAVKNAGVEVVIV